MYNRTMYELYFYNDEGKNPSLPVYVKSLDEVKRECKKRDIHLSNSWLSKHIIGKVPRCGGQAIRLRVYTTTLLDIINHLNQTLSNGELFRGIHTPPTDTVKETMETHGMTFFRKGEGKQPSFKQKVGDSCPP